jgi:hypothetical protein
LSPKNGKVALVAKLEDVQLRRPNTLFQKGKIEIWETEQAKGFETGVDALADTLAWFPDGRQLSYVDLVDRRKLSKLAEEFKEYWDVYAEWSVLPAVYVLDTVTSEKRLVHPGRHVVVSRDGKAALISLSTSSDFRTWLVSFETQQVKAVKVPGGGSIALIDQDTVVYRGLPTSGSEIRYTENNSPIVGPKPMMTIKVADIPSGKFQTILPYVDPRGAISFGVLSKG